MINLVTAAELGLLALGGTGYVLTVRWWWQMEFGSSKHRPRRCDHCGDMHEGWHRCPNKLVGYCPDCGRKRFLSRVGRCPAGHGHIAEVSFRWNQHKSAEYPT